MVTLVMLWALMGIAGGLILTYGAAVYPMPTPPKNKLKEWAASVHPLVLACAIGGPVLLLGAYIVSMISYWQRERELAVKIEYVFVLCPLLVALGVTWSL